MKKLVIIILTIAMIASCFAFSACDNNQDTIIVFTNAFFAPFEYYDGTKIVGVDVDIMNKVGDSLNKKVVFEDKDFSTLIDYVAEGKLCDCAAAGFTITEERLKKVDFSVTYYTSFQYVIFKKGEVTPSTATDGTVCIYWSDLAGKKIGTQLDTTGNIYVEGEIEGWEEGVPGELTGTGATCQPYDDAQLAYSNLKSENVDCVMIDELPAKYLIKNDTATYVAYPLFYDADTPTIEEYGIAVNKDNSELLAAINNVLNTMLNNKNAAGENEIEQLVKKHFGM